MDDCYAVELNAHFFFTTIGSDLETVKETENQHTPYIGPGPGKNTGTHRYVFLLYQQKNGKQEFKPMDSEEKAHRRQFQLREFEAENQLELVTVNFFTCLTSRKGLWRD